MHLKMTNYKAKLQRTNLTIKSKKKITGEVSRTENVTKNVCVMNSILKLVK